MPYFTRLTRRALRVSASILMASAGATLLCAPRTLAGPPGASEVAQTPAKAAPGKARTFSIADTTQLAKAIRAARGKVLLVNFWATWCPPCVAEFPDLVRLHRQHQAQGFQLLSVAIDSTPDRNTLISGFVAKQKPAFPIYLRPLLSDDVYLKSIDADWEGAMPRTYLLDKSGRVRKIISGPIIPAEVETLVGKLLAEKPGVAAAGRVAGKSGKGVLGS